MYSLSSLNCRVLPGYIFAYDSKSESPWTKKGTKSWLLRNVLATLGSQSCEMASCQQRAQAVFESWDWVSIQQWAGQQQRELTQPFAFNQHQYSQGTCKWRHYFFLPFHWCIFQIRLLLVTWLSLHTMPSYACVTVNFTKSELESRKIPFESIFCNE